ncbi:MAG TPA: DUF1499 domain-containing protein [Abditibacteriaceae bacterium]|nr:DUF1499 domain-containing protein [Abditibacteriaceae bacterium]
MRLLRKHRVLRLLAPGIVVVAVLILGAMNPTNVARTRPDHPDPRLRTRRYQKSINQARRIVVDLIPTLKTYGRNWRHVVENGMLQISTGEAKIERVERAEVPVFFFTDDLSVTLRGNTQEVTIDVRSAARVGRGDFGENRRHVLQLLRALDKKMNE